VGGYCNFVLFLVLFITLCKNGFRHGFIHSYWKSRSWCFLDYQSSGTLWCSTFSLIIWCSNVELLFVKFNWSKWQEIILFFRFVYFIPSVGEKSPFPCMSFSMSSMGFEKTTEGGGFAQCKSLMLLIQASSFGFLWQFSILATYIPKNTPKGFIVLYSCTQSTNMLNLWWITYTPKFVMCTFGILRPTLVEISQNVTSQFTTTCDL